MDKDETSKNSSEPFKPTETLRGRHVTLSLGDVGDYMRAHNLRLRRIVDKDGTILYPRQ